MRVQNILNSRPRKRLGYMTPKEKYKSLTNKEFDAVALSVWIQHRIKLILNILLYIESVIKNYANSLANSFVDKLANFSSKSSRSDMLGLIFRSLELFSICFSNG